MKKKSYFLLSRTIFDSPVWNDDPHILKLFIYLIGQARFDKQPKRFHGFELKRGELVTSLSDIAENNQYSKNGTQKQWSRQKVSRMLAVLKEQKYIKIISDTYGTHINICNYETYQDKNYYKSDSGGTKLERDWNGTGTGLDTYNNGNNGNTDKNGKYIPESDIFSFWNDLKIIRHIDFIKFKPFISAKLKLLSEAEIKETCSNYKQILCSEKHYFSHKWGLDEFLTRKGGFDKFRTVNKPFDNWLKDVSTQKKLGLEQLEDEDKAKGFLE